MSGSDEEVRSLVTIAADLARAAEIEPGVLLAKVPDPTGDSLDADRALAMAAAELRGGYLRAVAERTSRRWRTPRTGERIRFPGTELAYDYAYDRQHPPVALERRLTPRGTMRDRVYGGLLCSSGMSTIQVVLQALAHVSGADTPRLGALASYFETLTAFRVSRFAHRWARFEDSADLAAGIRGGQFGVIFLEPLRYDWALGAVDWPVIIEAIAAATAPPVVVIDTTLSAASPTLDAILDALAGSRIPLLITVRSGLKFDQEGLELANLGVIEWGLLPDTDPYTGFADAARACRVVSGATLGWPESCALAPAFVLDHSRLSAYAARIFENHRTLGTALGLTGDLFSEVVGADEPLGTPFLLLKLRKGGEVAYRQLAELLAVESRRRELGWTMSGSFGFRDDRFETILPREQHRAGELPEGVLKVSAGCYRGARFRAVTALLQELAAFDTLFEAVRAWSRRSVPVAPCN